MSIKQSHTSLNELLVVQERIPQISWTISFFAAVFGLLLSVFGAAQQVTLKLSQYAMINHTYTFCFVVVLLMCIVNLIGSILQSIYSKTLPPFPPLLWLCVVGILETISVIATVVGGRYLPAITQTVLSQFGVPIVMMCVCITLYPKGCQRCRSVVRIFKQHGSRLRWTLQPLSPTFCDTGCSCRVVSAAEGDLNINRILTIDPHAGGSKNCLSNAIRYHHHLTVHAYIPSIPVHISRMFDWIQYFGSAVIMGGVIAFIVPEQAIHNSPRWKWVIVFTLGVLSQAVSAGIKERYLTSNLFNIWFNNLLINIEQLMLLVLAFPVIARLTNSDDVLDTFSDISNGISCIWNRKNTIVDECSRDTSCLSGKGLCCDSCDGTFSHISSFSANRTVISFLICSAIYQVLLHFLLANMRKGLRGVAIWRAVSMMSCLNVPMVALVFAFDWMVSQHHVIHYSTAQIIGIVVVFVGLVVHRRPVWRQLDESASDSSPPPNVLASSHITRGASALDQPFVCHKFHAPDYLNRMSETSPLDSVDWNAHTSEEAWRAGAF